MRLVLLLAPLFAHFLVGSAAAEINATYLMEAGVSRSIAVQGDLLLGGLGNYLLVIDATDISNPERIASEYISTSVGNIEWHGQFAYLASDNGLLIYDMSDPLNPVKVGEEISASASGLAVQGNVAYVSGSTTGFRSVDVSDPAHPVVIGNGSVQGWPREIRVVGEHAYVTGFLGDLAVVDISDPNAPTQVGFLAVWDHISNLDVVGNLAYVSGIGSSQSGGLAVIDVSDETAPTEIGRCNLNQLAACVAVRNNYAYVFDGGQNTFDVVDISDPSTPAVVEHFVENGAVDVVMVEDRLYTADLGPNATNGSSFTIRSISNPTTPAVEGTLERLDLAHTVTLQDQRLCVGQNSHGLTILDVQNTTQPSFVGSASSSYGSFQALCPNGSLLYVGRIDTGGGDFGGLSVFDISDPSAPFEANFQWGFAALYEIHQKGAHVYAVGYRSGYKLVVYDASNPTLPVETASVGLSPVARDFQIAGDLALIANHTNDLKIYDISNPLQTPILRSTFTETQDAYDVACMGELAFVADRTIGLVVVDFSNPSQPTEIGRLTNIGQPENIVAKHPYLVLTGDDPMLRVVDVSDPTTPVVVDSYQAGASYGVVIEGSTIATIVGGSVLLLDAPILNVVSSVETNTLPRLSLAAHPNPFNPGTTITFNIPTSRHVELDVFDATGRRVRSILRGALSAGTHRTAWDGRDGAGIPSASGVYFCRLRAGNETVNHKLVLLK